MKYQREWPLEYTTFVLDYVDRNGDTLAIPGYRRNDCLKKLLKLLNAKVRPRPQPSYSIEELREHCSFLKERYSVFQGPNLTAFFKYGRAYLRPPFGTATSPDDGAACESMPTPTTEINKIAVPSLDLDLPSYILKPRPRPRPSYIDNTTKSPSKSATPSASRRKYAPSPLAEISIRSEQIGLSTSQEVPFSPGNWQALFGLRSKNQRLPQEDIEPAMVRLGRNAYKAVESYLDSSNLNYLARPDIDYINQCHPPLAKLLESVVPKTAMAASAAAKLSNVTLLRSLIAWVVYKWIFLDTFPVLGTESGGIWDDLEEILKERGAYQFLPYFEDLRLDLQFRLSQKAKLLQETLPARAEALARSFASLMEPLFTTIDASGQRALFTTGSEQCFVSNNWMPSLQKTFLDALEIIVKLRQRKTATEFRWLLPGETFDDFWMQAENNGTKQDFSGSSVLLTLAPAAFSWIPNDDKRLEMEEIVYYKATVFLDIENIF